MKTSPCRRTVLASGPSAEVARCTCGHLHLSVGPVTLRMDEDTLHAAWHTMGDALRSLTEPLETAEPAPLASAEGPAVGGWKQ